MSNPLNISRYQNLNNSNNNIGFTPLNEGVTTVWLLSILGGGNTSNRNLHNFGNKGNGNGNGNVNKTNNNHSSNTTNTTTGGRYTNDTVKRKDIINVSIPKTCKVIEKNDLDLPLRYVSNLLYGITLCYNRKTEYVLNDLSSLLSQLHKRFYNYKTLIRKSNLNSNDSAYNNIGNNNANKKKSNGKKNTHLLNDDPTFDINEVKNIEIFLGLNSTINNLKNSNNSSNISGTDKNNSNGSIIKRQDILNELSNSNNLDNPILSRFDLFSRDNPITLDEIPLDVDFNLDIDDIISQHGTSIPSTHDLSSSDHIELRDNNREFNLNFDENEEDEENRNNNISNIDLGISAENISDQSEEASLEDESTGDFNKKELTIYNSRNDMTHYLHNWSNIKYDERTGLSTDMLRDNFSNYCDKMERHKKNNRKTHRTEFKNIDDIKLYFDNSLIATTLIDNWKYLLEDNIPKFNNLSFLPIGFNRLKRQGSDIESVERGRKRSRSLSYLSRSNSVPSEEHGRKISNERDGSFINNEGDESNLILNLEQINEELDEHNNSFSTHNYMQMNLELPPSSFGRNNTRTSGTIQSTDNDVVDILQTRMLPNKRVSTSHSNISSHFDELESDSQSEAQGIADRFEQQQILDFQTKKFYDYIKERSEFAGKNTNSFRPYNRKILFESLVPSSISQDSNPGEILSVDKRIAASAFLSLLNLASKDMVGIKKFEEHPLVKPTFTLLNGDEIIVYV
ncbi:hypothetical protein Kpol_1050p10 [Vanderwaltozyma polyspora DSM 70294]|uniref:Rad21/Rec8-like protein N-terminal domain-containing protein n=1 Tax=Vanderwaltozyma polyspora (strain ATCC 22028 / DSM 70294 / BCRC 21397 / CBS 2163 / NBRC 10782 / NRRL Y-8283 / UCD 57-17) TaxID=436907 RepID=A7TEQ7_VANPO|nr:uncharacterized protein Kpol_1050p10 [Vanderwaltozyma polyspora DSM 70294]EDO19153.1 hypothetical protein Kpol_1050p10 [Vanderwaltozyma polyspora DSM 70294]